MVKGIRTRLCNGCGLFVRRLTPDETINIHREHFCEKCYDGKTRKPRRERDNQEVPQMRVDGADSASFDEC